MERLVRESESWEEAGYKKEIKYDETQIVNEAEGKRIEEADKNLLVSEDEETPQKKAYNSSLNDAFNTYKTIKSEMRVRLEKLGELGSKLMKNFQIVV